VSGRFGQTGGLRRTILAVALFCAMVQAVSATWVVKEFDTPNHSTMIARNLAKYGTYFSPWTVKLKGPVQDPGSVLRRFILPGEPLFLAALFRLLPERLHRYIHVPVTVLLVTSIAAVAAWMGGGALGIATGLLASVWPFVAIHGPVWDDAFLGAALVWLVVAVLCFGLESKAVSAARLATLFFAAGWASITRMECQMDFLLIAAAVFLIPAMRSRRAEALAILLGVAVAVGAWALRNRLVLGEFAIGSSHDGVSLWESNGPNTRKALARGQTEMLTFSPETMAGHWARTARMTENDINRYYVRQAARYMAGHPAEVLATALLKLAISLSGVAPQKPLTSARNLVALLSDAALLAFGLRGLFLLRPRPESKDRAAVYCLLLLIAAPTILMLLIGGVGLRYRITSDGILWMGSAASILHYLQKAACAA
jgi:hypothetical protein